MDKFPKLQPGFNLNKNIYLHSENELCKIILFTVKENDTLLETA